MTTFGATELYMQMIQVMEWKYLTTEIQMIDPSDMIFKYKMLPIICLYDRLT